MRKKNKKRFSRYPNGGDGMFFYHKKTGHPAKQLAHTEKTWTNRRYTHSPNRPKDYELDLDDFLLSDGVYKTKAIFVDIIYTRGREFITNRRMHGRKKKKR